MTSNYNGIYVGVVVQNNDPEHRGRAKIYVPHVNAGVYENWYNVKKNKSFRFVGRNVDSDLGDILSDLKNILPWAEQASPMGGQSATGRYNAYTDTGSVSDTNTLTNFAPVSGHVASKYGLNTEGIGEKPARKYETEQMRLNDAFSSADYGAETGVKHPNKYSYNYRPSSYSNSAKGVFGVPNVGAHVWCFFHEGDPNAPIYFAAAFGQQDWESVFGNADVDGVDYPGAYENQTNADSDAQDINIETYRNKFLINQKGGTLEFVNTDNREILKMTHYSGSFKEFNNHTNVELATRNDQKLVLQDQYLTVNGYGGWYVGRDLDHIIQGDHFLRVGHQNTPLHRAWREKARELHKVKQLFEIKRCDASADKAILPGAFVSPDQKKSGKNQTPCPVCNSESPRKDTYYDLNQVFIRCDINTTTTDDDPATDPGLDGAHGLDKGKTTKHVGAVEISNGSTMIEANEARAGKGVAPEASPGYLNATARKGEAETSGGKTIFTENCPSCGGTGFIQGSMDGEWDEEDLKKSTDWLAKAKQVIGELADIEASLGMGGSEVINVAKHKTETIGLIMNDFGSVRMDLEGKYYKNSVQVLDEGVVNTRVVSPLIEYVHVDDLPGGSYTLNVCNRWNVQVGAGGVSMKSYGPVDIGGTITNIGGTQVNIGSENEVNIDGGRRLNIVSDILTLRQRDGGQVLVDSNLGVSRNVVIGGGMHVEGELSLNHVTAPTEIQETEQTIVHSYLLSGMTFWCDITGGNAGTHASASGGTDTDSNVWRGAQITLRSDSSHNHVKSYAHSHHFKNLPLRLKSTNRGVRSHAKSLSGDRVPAQPREFKNSENKSEFD